MRPHPPGDLNKPPLLILGGGGHALVVAEAAARLGWTVAGFLDDGKSPVLAVAGQSPAAKHLGGLDRLEAVARELGGTDAGGLSVIIAVGDAVIRRRLIGRLSGLTPATLIHPSAEVSPTARIGAGVFIGPRAVVHTRAVVGDHAIVNTGAIVEHECVVGENVHVAPGAILGGRARVDPDALVGIGSRIMLSRTIGRGAVIGCGAVVVKDVAPGAVVKGVPAR